MAVTDLSKDDLWDLTIGGSLFSSGGGGLGPTREQFDRITDSQLAAGLKPRLISVDDIPDDERVFLVSGAGGGVTRSEQERWLASPGFTADYLSDFDATGYIRARLREMEPYLPLCGWSELPGPDWMFAAKTRLAELVNGQPVAYLAGEVSRKDSQAALIAAADGKPLLDADTAGRAVPETSLSTLNVVEAPIAPVVVATMWGDLLVYEKILNYQRVEDITRAIAATSGGTAISLSAVLGSTLKQGGVVAGTISRAIGIGRTVRLAAEGQRDVVQVAAQALAGYILFRGRVMARVNEDRHGFIWGNTHFEGTGDFAGRCFRIWYKNENLFSWLDGRPYVMAPDLISVIDLSTGMGLSNFAPDEWQWGRDVAIIGIPCAPVWRSERGRQIFHPARWGFACDYVPIEEAIGQATATPGR